MFEFSVGTPVVRHTYFVDVILPLAIQGLYTYRVPHEWSEQVSEGKRVVVQFGKNKIYAGLVYRVHQEAPQRYEAKYILDVLDDVSIVTPEQYQLWDWMARYYMCTVGEVMQAALPSALKLASETKIIAASTEGVDRMELGEKEHLILDALDISAELRVSDIVKLLGQKTVFPILKRLFDQGLILISEEISERYKPKRKSYIVLADDYTDDVGKRMLLERLNRASKQQDAVLAYFQLSKAASEVTRKELMETAGVGTGTVSALVDKGVFVVQERIVSRLGGEDVELVGDFTLNKDQENALEKIQLSFRQQDVALLHGVTASGKTQIYIRLIEDVIASGRQALYLLPEIALTTQVTERLRLHFGDKLGVYHSRFSDNERAEVWQKVLKAEYQVVIGARSAIFLPFNALGMVVVDEEHEVSYKQYEPAPRYHARDSAIYLAHLYNAKVLLGSATPSVESYYNAKSGKYGLATLERRYGDSLLPTIEVVNVKEQAASGKMLTYFSTPLLEQMGQAIERKEQVILFQNRRGHTPLLQCQTCGYITKCIHCDVSMTFHKSSGKLHCHYCGFTEELLKRCPACGSAHIESKGYGTQRIEEELELLLPNARIGRLDFDSTRGKYGFERVLNAFDDHEYDILVGTQMVAKGLDFGKVSLIGIINADTMINYPDFRAFERAFAMFAQVGGRAGRRDLPGKVLIQTYTPEHRVIKQVVENDYGGMFMAEVTERKNYAYPPFYRLIRIDLRHKDQQVSHDVATRLAGLLRDKLGSRVLGPEVPLVGRVRTYYINSVLLKIERKGVSVVKVKDAVSDLIHLFSANKENRGVRIQIDVDPY